MSDKCCGKRVSLGQGAVAICGENFYSEKFVCDKCKIAKQAEQIKLLSEASAGMISALSGYNNPPQKIKVAISNINKALNQTGGE